MKSSVIYEGSKVIEGFAINEQDLEFGAIFGGS